MAAEAGLTSSGIGKVCFWLHGKSRRNRFFAVRTEFMTELLTQRRESRGGGRGAHCRGGPIDHNDVTLKFGGAGDGEVQGKAVVVWRGKGRKRTGVTVR